MKIKVTIGICGRNCQDIVGFALESVAKQDFQHESMEIVFVDDGSEDNTLKVVKEHLSRMDISSQIFSGKWQGLGKARNTVIENAKGDYIVWVDSDETLKGHYVRKQVDLMERDSKIGIASARLGILPNENLILTLDLVPSVVEYSPNEWNNPSKMPGTGGATYRVAAARQVGGFDERIKGTGEDIDLANRVRRAGWSIVRGDGIFYERHGGLSTWRDLWKRYVHHGVHGRHLYRKSSFFFSYYRMNPIASFVASILYTYVGYRLTKRKVVFLLPFHFTLKMTAWFYGFTKGEENPTSRLA